MKSERYDGRETRQILIGMITDQTVCSRIASKWNRVGLFSQPWANLVGSWCVKYLTQYSEPPNGNIESIFRQWASKNYNDDETINLIDKFLQVLSDQYDKEEKHNSDFLIDLAARHFDKVKIKQTIDIVQDDLFQNDIDAAYGELTKLNRVELGTGSLCKIAEDEEAWQRAFDEERRQALITYPGSLGVLLGDIFCREGFVSFQGMDKVGKSYFLLDLAVRGAKQRNRVAYFDTGDMTQDDNLLRLGSRIARRPLKSGTIKMPADIVKVGEEEYEVRFDEQLHESALSWRGALDAVTRLTRGKDIFRLSCHANSSLSVHGIKELLLEWSREEWVADVVVIDYADLLLAPFGAKDRLDQIDMSWRLMRQLSQELHCLVVTATQSSARVYVANSRRKLISRQHFGERKTKNAHVTAMIGINMFPGDDEKELRRLNVVLGRHDKFSESTSVKVAGCLDIANPIVVSSF